MGALLDKVIDKFATNLSTWQGPVRKIRRDALHEMRDREKARKKFAEYIIAIKQTNIDAVDTALLEHGYLVLLEDEYNLLFDQLHMVVREFNKVIGTLKGMENEFARVHFDDTELKQKIAKAINHAISILEDGLKWLLGNIAGIESFTMSSAKQAFLERESQIQAEAGETLKARRMLKDYRKIEKTAEGALKAIEGHVHDNKELLNLANSFQIEINVNVPPGSRDSSVIHNQIKAQTEKYDIGASLTALAKELNSLASYSITLLNQAHQDLQHFKSGGVRTPLSTLDANHPPSFALLAAPYPDGYGFPNKGPVYERINARINSIEQQYQDRLKRLLNETRLFISELEHMKLAA